MSLMKRLLAGLSSVALLAAAGLGLQRTLADDNQLAALPDVGTVPPLEAMSLVELAAFVAENVSSTASSPMEAASEFGALMSQMTPPGEPHPPTLMAVANAFQLMLEELFNIYGPFDTETALDAARASYLAALPPAAGLAQQTAEVAVGPDLGPVGAPPY